jgi:hypothetical protein
MEKEGDRMSREEVSRRDFLKGVAILCASSVAGVSGMELPADAADDADGWPGYIERGTMRAFADTVVPGPTSDPEGAVGGIEAGALEVLYDLRYGLRLFISTLSRDLNRTSLKWHRRLFKDLDLAQRTEILMYKDDNSGMKSLYELAELLVKVAFYGGVINDVGTDYMSFPGPSLGYDDYSFNEKFAEEATEDGNLP